MKTSPLNRRTVLGGSIALVAAPVASSLAAETKKPSKSVDVQFLEIVTPDVKATVALYSKFHGVSFSEPNPVLGGGRTAKLNGGGVVSIRGPLRETEEPVVRVYHLVENIAEALAAAGRAGAEIAMGPTPIPGQGKFAIFILGGIETGLWQV